MAAGDFLVRRNVSNTDAIPAAGSDLLLLWDTQDSVKGTTVTYSAGTFTLVDSGKYLVLCSDYEQGLGTGDNNRINTKMTLNLGGAEQLQGYSSGFIRNLNSGQIDSVPYSAAIITATANSQLQIRKERVDNTAQVANRVANNRSGVTVIKLDDTLDYGVYEGALFATSATDDASVVADISTTIEQGSSLSRSGDIVTVADTGRYLAVYTIKSEDPIALNRSEYQSNISVNGAESKGSWGQTYIRSSDDCTWGGISNASLLNLSANDEVTLNVVSREDGGETFLATLQLMKLPDTAKTITTTATTGNFTILNIDFDWPTTEHIDSDVFSFTSGTSDLTVLADDDYIALTGQAALSYSSGERRIPSVQFKLNNIALNLAGNSCYSRGINNAGHPTLSTGGLISALTNDYIGVYNNRLSDAGTSVNCDSGAMSLIQLSSIIGSSPGGIVEDAATDLTLADGSIDSVSISESSQTNTLLIDGSLDLLSITEVVTTNVSLVDASIDSISLNESSKTELTLVDNSTDTASGSIVESDVTVMLAVDNSADSISISDSGVAELTLVDNSTDEVASGVVSSEVTELTLVDVSSDSIGLTESATVELTLVDNSIDSVSKESIDSGVIILASLTDAEITATLTEIEIRAYL